MCHKEYILSVDDLKDSIRTIQDTLNIIDTNTNSTKHRALALCFFYEQSTYLCDATDICRSCGVVVSYAGKRQ